MAKGGNELMQLSLFSEPTQTSTPWNIYPQQWESGKHINQVVNCNYDGQYICWGNHTVKVTEHLRNKYLNPRLLIDYLQDCWLIIECIKPVLECGPQKKEVLAKATGQAYKQVEFALKVGCDIGLFERLRGRLYALAKTNT